jgi:peptidoglycan/LPS O-acetylase OafA/YrhL
LDGWRALSILMVLGEHTGWFVSDTEKPLFHWIFDGNLGVRFFFVISGFLITWLLLQETNQSRRINLKYFYVRRFLRILPVYYMFVLVLLGLQLFTQFKETTAGWLGMLTFTRNFMDASFTSAHIWVLSVEAQFYLIWPSLLVLLSRRSIRVKAIILAIPICTAPIFRVGNYIFCKSHQHLLRGLNGIHLKPAFLERVFSFGSFFCYFDSLAFGCLCAILLANKQNLVASIFKQRRGVMFVAALLLVVTPHLAPHVMPHVFTNLTITTVARIVLLPFGQSFQALGFSLLLLHSLIDPDWCVYRILNWKWVGWIGVLSYSLYIWQQIFWSRPWMGTEQWKDVQNSSWAWYWLIPTFAVAIISYYGLERPLFRLRSYFRHA